MVKQHRGSIICTASVVLDFSALRQSGLCALQCKQGGPHQCRADRREPIERHWCPHQRHLPGSDRDGNDSADLSSAPAPAAAKAKRSASSIHVQRARACRKKSRRLALFLVHPDAASYVNGQALVVDGGLSSSHPTVIPR